MDVWPLTSGRFSRLGEAHASAPPSPAHLPPIDLFELVRQRDEKRATAYTSKRPRPAVHQGIGRRA